MTSQEALDIMITAQNRPENINIEIVCVYPPIPNRNFDYCAYIDPEGVIGWGPTKETARQDFLDKMAIDD